jgi:hypothetical protein
MMVCFLWAHLSLSHMCDEGRPSLFYSLLREKKIWPLPLLYTIHVCCTMYTYCVGVQCVEQVIFDGSKKGATADTRG